MWDEDLDSSGQLIRVLTCVVLRIDHPQTGGGTSVFQTDCLVKNEMDRQQGCVHQPRRRFTLTSGRHVEDGLFAVIAAMEDLSLSPERSRKEGGTSCLRRKPGCVPEFHSMGCGEPKPYTNPFRSDRPQGTGMRITFGRWPHATSTTHIEFVNAPNPRFDLSQTGNGNIHVESACQTKHRPAASQATGCPCRKLPDPFRVIARTRRPWGLTRRSRSNRNELSPRSPTRRFHAPSKPCR